VAETLAERYAGVVCDLDGVVRRGAQAVPYAVEQLLDLRVPIVYATNNASLTPQDVADQLLGLGLPVGPANVVTSSQAGAAYVASLFPPDSPVLAVGGPGVAAAHTSRGCAFGDFDNDGDMDVVIVNMNEPPSLLRNDVSGSGHWLKVLLMGVQSNRSAIGARVIARYGARTQAQDVTAQASFYSANDRRLHFGLGAAASADLTIRWPSGAMETVRNVAADQLVVIREGAGVVRTQKFR